MTTTPDVVLLVTHSEDYYNVDRVASALQRRGAHPVRFNTDQYPSVIGISSSVGGCAVGHRLYLGDEEISSSSVRAVWNRRIAAPRLGDELDENFRKYCARESMAALNGFWDGLRGARWINHHYANYMAEDKIRQLRVADAAGLTLPRTLVSNRPAEVREFFNSVERGMVAKLLRPLSQSMGKAPVFVRTNIVAESDLEGLDSLRFCPMVFQENIPKACELRICLVSDKAFVGALDASQSRGGTTDWRMAEPGEVSWKNDNVPDDVLSKLRSLMKSLELINGAVDMIRTPDGEHVFLEINPAGEWGMLERDLNLPISEAIADALLIEGDQNE